MEYASMFCLLLAPKPANLQTCKPANLQTCKPANLQSGKRFRSWVPEREVGVEREWSEQWVNIYPVLSTTRTVLLLAVYLGNAAAAHLLVL
jgi:hypothetical protein